MTPGGIARLPDPRAAAALPVAGLLLPRRCRRRPARPDGLAYMASGLLDEGAGALDSQAFRDRARGPRDPAVFRCRPRRLLGRAEDADRAPRARLRAAAPGAAPSRASTPSRSSACAARSRPSCAALEADPDYLASRAWFERAFPGHPYGRPTRGTPESVAALTRDELRRLRPPAASAATISCVGVAGDITRRGARAPARPRLRRPAAPSAPPEPEAPAPADRRAPSSSACAIPQSVVIFGGAGLAAPRSRLLRRLRRQLHPGRRRLHLAADRGGAREARPRLLGLHLPLRPRARAVVAGRRRHQERAGGGIDRA